MTTGTERLMHDGLGSVIGRVRSDATVAMYRYDAWGAFRGTSTPTGTDASLAYAGQHWDEDLGLSYAQQRWYEPGTGRFLSEDPVGWNAERLGRPTRGHAFGYAAGNPLLYTDPEGLDVGQPESTTRKAQEDMAYEAARNEWSKDEGNWVTGCLAAEADNWRHIDSAAFNARSKSPGWLAGYLKCQGRPVADAWYNSDIGKTTREFWTATPGRSQTMGCFIGGVNAITPVGGGDVNDLPASMQQSAGMCQFAVGGATLGVMLIEQGPGALQKLKDASKALKNEPALAAVTADGRTVAVAGKDASAAESVPLNMEARANGSPNVTGTTPGGTPRVSPGWRSRYGPAALREHHLVPQELLEDPAFVQRLRKLGVQDAQTFIDKRLVRIPQAEHSLVHGEGWNRDWKQWLRNNPNFTLRDVEGQISSQMRRYNIPASARNFTKQYGRN